MAEGVCAVLSTLHGGPLLFRCVASLRAQEPAPAQIVVSMAAGPVPCPEGVRVVVSQTRTHHASTANAGLQVAREPHLLVLNDDTCLQPGCLAALLAAWRTHGPGLYAPRIVLGDGRLDNAGHGLYPDGFNRARGRALPDGPAFHTPGTVGAVSGAAFLAQREVLETIGSFDADFEAFGEDADLSLRAVRHGYTLRYVPLAVVEHALGASYGRDGARKIYRVERNRVRLAARSLPVTALLTQPLWTPLRWAAMAAGALTGTGVAAGVDPIPAATAAVAGTLAGLLHTPDALGKRRGDRPRWKRGEWDMIRFLWEERVRSPGRSSPTCP